MVRILKDLPGVTVETKEFRIHQESVAARTEETIPAGTTAWLRIFTIPLRAGREIPRQRGRATVLNRDESLKDREAWRDLQAANQARSPLPIWIPLQMETMAWVGRNGWTPLVVTLPGSPRTVTLEELAARGREMMAREMQSSTLAHLRQAHG